MTILINHSKGGCGKSLVAFNIAIQLSKLKNKKGKAAVEIKSLIRELLDS